MASTENMILMKLRKNKPFTIKKIKYTINLVSTGYFRELEIRDKISKNNKHDSPTDMLRSFMVTKGLQKSELKASLDLKGVGISIVDKEPKEVIYLSLYRIWIKYSSEVTNRGNGVIENEEEVDLILYHMQIDNMVSLENPILFSPIEVLDKAKIFTDEEYTPFIQIKLSYSNNQKFNVSRKKIDALQVMIQKMKAEVETGTLNIILSTVGEINSAFDNQSTDYLSAQTMSQNQKKTLMVEGSSPHHQRHRSIKDKQGNDSIDDHFVKAQKKEIKEFRKEDVWEELNTAFPKPPELSEINTDKLYFKLVHIGAIRINITLKFEKRALNFDLNQGFGALTIVYTLATSIANVSDAPLSFKELLITNIFQSQASLKSMLIKNFVRQGMLQFYKLIGSSDLLGNPVGFVDKLGSGVFEFINEPRKGLIKGPKEFVGGIGKGVTSLVSGVVSASFDSVSKITGSLYSMAKNVTGQEALPQK